MMRPVLMIRLLLLAICTAPSSQSEAWSVVSTVLLETAHEGERQIVVKDCRHILAGCGSAWICGGRRGGGRGGGSGVSVAWFERWAEQCAAIAYDSPDIQSGSPPPFAAT